MCTAFKCRVNSGHFWSFLHYFWIWRTWIFLSSHPLWIFRGSNLFLLIGVKFPYIFFWKVWLLQKIRSLKINESFCHNLIFVAVTFSGIYSVLCRILSLVVGVYGVQLLIQLRPILETFITLGETASLKVFSRHFLWKFSSVKYFFISRINFSNDF